MLRIVTHSDFVIMSLPALFNSSAQAKTAFEFDRTPEALTDATPDNSITAILTVYKRAEFLQAQIDALKAQTIPPNEIWVWCNRVIAIGNSGDGFH